MTQPLSRLRQKTKHLPRKYGTKRLGYFDSLYAQGYRQGKKDYAGYPKRTLRQTLDRYRGLMVTAEDQGRLAALEELVGG